jgi:hypothetical protein
VKVVEEDEGLAAEVFGRDFGTARERVAAAEGEDNSFGEEGLDEEGGICNGYADEADVDIACADGGAEGIGGYFPGGELDGGKLPQEAIGDFGEEERGESRSGGGDDGAAGDLIVSGGGIVERGNGGKDEAGARK